MGRAFAPTVGKTLSISALAGLASEGASQIAEMISGVNVMADIVRPERTLAPILKKYIWKGSMRDFLIPHSKINQLIAHKHLLSKKRK